MFWLVHLRSWCGCNATWAPSVTEAPAISRALHLVPIKTRNMIDIIFGFSQTKNWFNWASSDGVVLMVFCKQAALVNQKFWSQTSHFAVQFLIYESHIFICQLSNQTVCLSVWQGNRPVGLHPAVSQLTILNIAMFNNCLLRQPIHLLYFLSNPLRNIQLDVCNCIPNCNAYSTPQTSRPSKPV